jgi:hypothetical protein
MRTPALRPTHHRSLLVRAIEFMLDAMPAWFFSVTLKKIRHGQRSAAKGYLQRPANDELNKYCYREAGKHPLFFRRHISHGLCPFFFLWTGFPDLSSSSFEDMVVEIKGACR